jgi:hypothetical protein
MGVKSGPKIAKDSLLIHLDASVSRSYSGSGNTWLDLSGNNNHGYLVNIPTFNSSEAASNFSFNGTDEYIDISTSPDTFSYNRSSFTVIGWTRYSSLPNPNWTGVILAKWNIGSSQNNEFILNTADNARVFGFSVDYDDGLSWNDAPNDTALTTTTYTTNTWYHVCGTFNNGLLSIYLNGILENSVTSAYTTVRTDNTAYLRSALFNNTIYSTGQRAVIQMYNRALTAQEVLQNYNATKRRYGL